MKGLASPEGVLMLCVAGLLDVIGFLIFTIGTWFGIDDYGILDLIAGAIMGLWMLLRHISLGSEGGTKTEEENEERGGEIIPGSQTTTVESSMATPEELEKKRNIAKQPKTQEELGSMAKLNTDSGQKGKGLKNPKSMAGQEIKNLGKKALKRFGLAGLIELIPFVGGIVPAWTIMVWREMKD